MRNLKTAGRKASLLVVGITAFSVAGLAVGAAVATSLPPVEAPKGVSAVAGISSTPMPAPVFSKNAKGLTYGSALKATSPDTEPDLISAVTSKGTAGYVYKTDLDEAVGSGFTSPDEALAWQRAHKGIDQTVTVYASNGETVIGDFIVTGPGTGSVVMGDELPPSSSK